MDKRHLVGLRVELIGALEKARFMNRLGRRAVKEWVQMLNLGDMIDRFSGVQSHEEGWDLMTRSISSVGGNAINVVSYNVLSNEINWVRSSMEQSWLDDYTAQGFASCDPFFHLLGSPDVECLVHSGNVDRSAAASSQSYELNHQLKDAGYNSLVAVKTAGVQSREGRLIVLSSEQKMGDFFCGGRSDFLASLCGVGR